MSRDEEEFERQAKEFLLGLFDGRSRIEVEEIPPSEHQACRKFVIRLFGPTS